MSFAFLELVQSDDGEILLRDGADDDNVEALLRIKFSGEILDMLGADAITLAEVMIDAATQVMSEVSASAETGQKLSVADFLLDRAETGESEASEASKDSTTIHVETAVLH
jgi:vacuolar-type H+-ATPase subunit H